MIVLYTNVKDFTEWREKGWHIFLVWGAEKNDLKGAFAFFFNQGSDVLICCNSG